MPLCKIRFPRVPTDSPASFEVQKAVPFQAVARLSNGGQVSAPGQVNGIALAKRSGGSPDTSNTIADGIRL